MIRQQPIESNADEGLVYEDFECRLVRALGAAIGGEPLSRALGYPSQDAFRKAQQRGRLPVATFTVEGRRGRFASAVDIAAWLWGQRSTNRHRDSERGAT